jgi:hypothetical protein
MKYWVLVLAALGACRGKPGVPSRTIQELVFRLEHSSCVITGGVGITGAENSAAVAYQKLLRIAPDSVWLALSHSKKPVARMYAFRALHFKNSPDLDRVRSRLRNDTALVCEIADDVTITTSIGDFVSH